MALERGFVIDLPNLDLFFSQRMREQRHTEKEIRPSIFFNLHIYGRFFRLDICINNFKGELNPKIDFSSFEHIGIVEQLYEVFLSC